MTNCLIAMQSKNNGNLQGAGTTSISPSTLELLCSLPSTPTCLSAVSSIANHVLLAVLLQLG
jgi:hypothetical protein